MKTAIKIVVILVFLGFAGIQFIRPARTNPEYDPKMTLEATTVVPKQVSNIISRSCKDCHSNETEYPWYSNIAPISWSVVDHVRVGRDDLNFSTWGDYSDSEKQRKLKEICREIENGSMPHNQYLWVHWDANLTDADTKSICDWTKKESNRIEENAPL